MTLLLNSEVECTQVVIHIFQGLQVFFLGLNSDFVTVCSLFACSAFTSMRLTTNLASQVARIKAASTHNASQVLDGNSHPVQYQR